MAELVRRGHRVTFATNARFAPLAAAAGAKVLEYESWLASRKLPERVDAEYLVHEPVRSIDEAIATVPVYERGFGDDVPDVLLYDVSTFAAGRVLARKWQRPAIELFATFASNEHYSLTQQIGALYADEIDREHPALIDFFVKQGQLLRDHGLTDVTLEEFNAAADDANLVFLPRSFQPAEETFDDRFAFVGACLGSRDDRPWTPPDDGRPLLLVSMGSFSFEHQKESLRTWADAFADSEWNVIVSADSLAGGDGAPPLPDNVRVHPWVPQLAVLEQADAFVSHAGMNSVMEAMYFGTPVVAVPHMPEQRLVADRLQELGLGVHLPEAEATGERVRAAVDRVVGDGHTRARVRALGEAMRAADGPARAADYVEEVAAGRRSAP
ncbi:MGT family glycosyltransferase [Streptomyces kunmingensis]|uniref:MGT family glycosyltransferase n=1 Tax=Streptomyces kunmingensis TaxID=68225 RepID=A0ABU6CCS6_9ACTN|nr:macrolide family glycosyltransferase [Streptomyces kunmingensis]MEB3961685.1 MGT family glycosyltransferase [Streptomyces kunmingensis]